MRRIRLEDLSNLRLSGLRFSYFVSGNVSRLALLFSMVLLV